MIVQALSSDGTSRKDRYKQPVARCNPLDTFGQPILQGNGRRVIKRIRLTNLIIQVLSTVVPAPSEYVYGMRVADPTNTNRRGMIISWLGTLGTGIPLVRCDNGAVDYALGWFRVYEVPLSALLHSRK